MRLRILPVLLVLLPAGATAFAMPERIWISLGDPAYGLLQELNPSVRPAALRRIDGNAGLFGTGTPDTIRVVQVSTAERDALAQAVHRNLHHCGGFMAHESLAAALQSLPPVSFGFIPTRPDYSIDQQPRVLPMLAAMSDTRIGDDIQSLASFQNRYYNGSHGAAAADWLAEQWQTLAAGRSDIHVDKVYRGSDAMPSVVLSIDGGGLANQVLVMGAHLDSVNWKDRGGVTHANSIAPGADDDASGVAGLTEVLRAILAANLRPQRSIRLMAYSGEEFGLYGSKYLANDYANRNVDVVGVLQLDMTNHQGSSADIYLIDDYTDAQQNAFLARLAATYLPTLVVAHDNCGYGCSDHVSWSAQGYAASFPFEARLGEDNYWIHSSQDTWTNSGSQALNALKFTRLAMVWLGELAFEGDLIFADGFQLGG